MREVYEQMDCWCVRGSICLYCKLCHSGLSAGLCLWMRYGSQRVVTVLRRRASKWPVLPAGSSFSSLSTASQWQMDPRQKKNRALCTKKEGLWYNSSMCCRHSGCKALCFSLPVSLSVSFCDIFFRSLFQFKNYTQLVVTQCVRLYWKPHNVHRRRDPDAPCAHEKRISCTHTLELWAKICLLWVRVIIERPSALHWERKRGKKMSTGTRREIDCHETEEAQILGSHQALGQPVVTTTRLGGHRGSSIRETALKSHTTEVNEAVFPS